MSNELFCERLRTLRRQSRLTQEMVANELNIHRSTYTKYECGVVAPDQQGLVRLAQLFGVTVDHLLGNDEGDATHISHENPATMKLSLEEQQLVHVFRQLNYLEQQQLVQQVSKIVRHKQKK